MVCTEVLATLARSTGLAGVRPDWSDTESTLNIEGVMLRVILRVIWSVILKVILSVTLKI